MASERISITLDAAVWRHVIDGLEQITPESSIGSGSKDEALASFGRDHAIRMMRQYLPKRKRRSDAGLKKSEQQSITQEGLA